MPATQSIVRSVEGCSGNFYSVLFLPRMREPLFSSLIGPAGCCQDRRTKRRYVPLRPRLFPTWSSSQLPRIHHCSNRPYMPLARPQDKTEVCSIAVTAVPDGCDGRKSKKSIPPSSFQHGRFIFILINFTRHWHCHGRFVIHLNQLRMPMATVAVHPTTKMCFLQRGFTEDVHDFLSCFLLYHIICGHNCLPD